MNSIPNKVTQTQALHDLRVYPQWVCFIFVSRGEKITKPPINPNAAEHSPLKERMADVSDPATWSSYETAVRRWKTYKTYKGIGFVFSKADPLCGIDLDDCVDPQTGEIAPWARHLLAFLNSYSEFSVSGTGIHIIIRASLEITRARFKLADIQHKKYTLEIYDDQRYFTWSGRPVPGFPGTIENRQEQLDTLYKTLFGTEEKRATPPAPTPPVAPSAQPFLADDRALIERAQTARGRNGRLFSQLWRGDLTNYRKTNGQIDYSRADLALCSILAYWTGKDATRIDRLFRQSALYHLPERKEKWDRPARSGESYGAGTIRIAIQKCFKTYDPSWRPDNTNSSLRKPSFSQNEGGAQR